ncbi:amidohydrolase [Nguyenibacter vanlangensis]|uniref:Amidohydrolase n=1 Tax=Nguyenibacter vanlangensis TaxID=1216886 RepID=A0ABZ3D038_9PROT
MSGNCETIWRLVDAGSQRFTALSDAVWEAPELNYKEYRSVALHKRRLEEEGFRVTVDVGGLPTAIMAESGEGGPVIAFLGEYDALPGLSQQAGATERMPLSGDGNGHGCGHNLLGAGAALAANAIREWLATTGTPGRVRYYGCPAEEGGAGKGFMVREGVFDDVDIAISWHPFWIAGVAPAASLASQRIDFTFVGRAAHAAAAPFLGRSALDAAELMNIGANYLREHMLPTSRIHYAYVDAGGTAPNVVQSRAVLAYSVRAMELDEMLKLAGRVRRIAEGAAMMTETTMSSRVISGMAELLPNRPLEQAMQRCLERLGPPRFSEADRAVAREMRKTFSEGELQTARRLLAPLVRGSEELVVCDVVPPLLPEGQSPGGMMGSTDVGDVSWQVPTVQALGATCAIGTALHSWQMVAQGKSSLAHTGMIHVAKLMAATAIEVLTQPGLLDAARSALADKLRRASYVCPIPADVSPSLDLVPEI